MVTQVTTANFSSATLTALTSPTITSITVTNSSYVATGATAVELTGGYVTVVGSSFVSGATVYIDSTPATAVTFVNSTQLNVQVPGLASNSYIVYVINLDGSVAIRVNGINYSANPTWVTSGTQAYTSGTISLQLVASSDSTVIYTVASGSSLPAGLTLTSSGLLSGVVTGSGIITYNFSVVATDVETQRSTQAFSITITFSDPYWNYTTLLLNGETPVTSFITDASTNNFNSTIAGDTRPIPFIPYQAGYYSNFFDGTGDGLTVSSTSSQFGFTGNFTWEAWINPFALPSSGGFASIICSRGTTASNSAFQFNLKNVSGTYGIEATISIGASDSSLNWNIPTSPAIGTWYHVAIVRIGSSVQAYWNGTAIGSPQTASGTTNTPTVNPSIGFRGGSYNDLYFTGYISNFRMVGSAVYTSTFTPSTTPLTAISETRILTCQSNRLIDNSLNNFTITKNGDTTVAQFNPFGIPTSTTVNNLYSTYFDGTGDYISTPSNITFAFGTGDYTVECWAYPIPAGKISRLFQFSDSNDNFDVNTNGPAYTLGYVNYWNGSTSAASASAVFTNNTWNHFAIVRSSGTVKVYVNGALVVTQASTPNTVTARSLAIGGTSADATFSLFYGNVSNFRVVKGIAVYTTAFTPGTTQLTSTQLANVNGNPSVAITGTETSLLTCQNSTIIDNSSYVFPLTSNGDARPIAFSPFTQTTTSVALTTLGGTYFDGTGDYLTTSSPSMSGTWTVEFWVYMKVGATQQTFANFCVASYSGINFWVNTSNQLVVDDGLTGQSAFTGGTLAINQWNHVAFVRNVTTTTGYINGVAVGSNSFTPSTVSAINIGRLNTGLYYFTGYISNFRTVIGTALYTANFAPPVQPLTAVTNTQLLTLQYNGGANNSGIIDNSSLNNVITRFGNTSQGTFSPYGDNWSNYFNGSGDNFLALNSGAQNFYDGNPLTVEGWFFASASSDNQMATNYGSSSTGWGIGLYAGKLNTNLSGDVADIIGTTTVVLNTWNHFALSGTAGSWKQFLNGVQEGSTYTGSVTLNSSATLTIGALRWSGATYSRFSGYISNVRVTQSLIYTTTFTPPTTPLTPVTSTYLLTCNSYRIGDSGPNNIQSIAPYTGGTVSVQRFSPFGNVIQTPISYSGYFNGVGAGLITPATTGNLVNTDFTWEAWVNFTSLSASSCIIASGSTADRTVFYYDITNGLRYAVARSAADQISIQQGSTSGWSTGTWYHVAIVRSGNNYTLYRNGVSIVTGTSAYSQSELTKGLTVGYSELSSSYLNITGSISNARVVNGVAVYTSTFTPGTAPLTTTQSVNVNGSPSSAITGTSTRLLTCQSTTFIDNSTNAFAITAYGTSSPRTVNPFGVTNNTNQSYTPALYGGSSYFDGSGDYLSIPSSSLLAVGTAAFTVEAWIYPLVLVNYSGIVAQNVTNASSSYWMFSVQADGVIRQQNWNTVYITSPASTIKLNQWQHVALVRNSSNNLSIYVNGISVATATNSTNFSINSINYIGAHPPDSGFSTWYMSDVRIVTGTAIYTGNFVPPQAPLTTYSNTTPASLLTNFTSGGIIDYHTNNVLETVGNAQLSTNIKKFGNASMYFDGTGDYLKGPISPVNQIGSGDYTFECWVYANGLAAAKAGEQTLITYGANGFLISIWTGNVHLAQDNVADKTDWASASVTNTTWFYLAVCRSGVSTRCFVNGVQAGSTYTDSTNYTGTTSIYIGANSAGTTALNGYLDEMRITKLARYTSSPFPVPTSAFQTI